MEEEEGDGERDVMVTLGTVVEVWGGGEGVNRPRRALMFVFAPVGGSLFG